MIDSKQSSKTDSVASENARGKSLFVFSDAHLGANDPDTEKVKRAKALEMISIVKERGYRLVILGDLFDFWFEYKHAIPKQQLQIVFRLGDLVESGIPVDYVSGNHDFWLGDFLTDEVGITIHREELILIEQGKKIFFIHGDGLAPQDWPYRILKRILRNRTNIRLYRLLPADWGISLARWVSGSSRKHTSKRTDLGIHSFHGAYEDYARTKLKEGYDAVLIGHLHTPLYHDWPEGIYINTGEFIRRFNYVEMKDGKLELKEL
ncbi:MAG: UDP-2,3-diacylglucosamine diphosphatase [candidate division Zixibacteria bacterium]|nr:UDP-2,3-diacylglucosamine diphosphatase [candidate division Zixibacteria bacterium]